MYRGTLLSLAAAGIALSAQAVSAADIARPVYKAAPAQAAVYNWTGFYIGGNGGYGWHDRTANLSGNDPSAAVILGFPGSVTPLANPNFDVDGGFGGFQVGYNWQFHPRWLAGLEADFDFADLKGRGTSSNISLAVVTGTATVSDQIKWFGTVRARLGYLVTNELLLYGTGGFAYGRVERQADYTTVGAGLLVSVAPNPFICTAGIACLAGSSSSVETGWTIGGGAEWALWNNLTFKAEYFYVNLGENSFAIRATAPLGGAWRPFKTATTLNSTLCALA